jgi:hypothetical protein
VASTLTTSPPRATLGTTLTNKNSVLEGIKSRLKSGNVCYHSVQNILSSPLLSKHIKIKIHRIIILPTVLYGFVASSLIMSKAQKLNNVLRKTLGPKGEEVTEVWRKLHNEELRDL